MNTLLQKPLAAIINAVLPILQKINIKIRNLVVELCFYIIALLLLFYRISAGLPMQNLDQGIRNKIIVFLFFVAALFSIKDRVKPQKSRWPIAIAWFLFCLSATVITLIHYSLFGTLTLILLWIILPVFFFIWANRSDYDSLFKMISRPFAHLYICYCIFILYLIIFSPSLYNIFTSGNRLQATTIHPNFFGILIVTGCVCCTYLIFVSRHIALRIFYGTGIVFAGVYLMMASSRASLLCLFAGMAVVLFSAFRKKERSAAALAGILLGIFILSSCIGLGASLVTVKNLTTAAAEETVDNTTNAVNTEELTETLKAKMMKMIRRYNPFGKSADSFSSGRITIWKAYLNRLNLTGENWEQRELEVEKEIGYSIAHAHSQYIQTANTMGIFTAVFELLLGTAAFILVLINALKKGKFNTHNIFCTLAVCSFYLLAFMEYIGEPSKRGLYILFLISLAPAFFSSGENDTDSAKPQS